MFFNEFGFSFQEPFARTWAPKGKRPVIRRVTAERQALSSGVGLTVSGKMYKRHFEGGMDHDDVISALEHWLSHIVGRFILLWNRAEIHTSKRTTAFWQAHPRIMVEWLPPYAPELNPEAFCHGNVKQHLKTARPESKVVIRRMLDRDFARLCPRPDLLLASIHAAGLAVRQLWLS